MHSFLYCTTDKNVFTGVDKEVLFITHQTYKADQYLNLLSFHIPD